MQETSLSDPPQEEVSAGDLRPENAASVLVHERPPIRDRGKTIAVGAMGALILVGIGLIAISARKSTGADPALVLTGADLVTSVDAGKDTADETTKKDSSEIAKPVALDILRSASPPNVVRPPPVWRVSSLRDDPSVEVTEGTFGKRGFVVALTQAGLSRSEIKRVAHAFEGARKVERPRETDGFVFAKDKSKGSVVAFEVATSPFDVWQARADESDPDKRIVVRKLDLFVEHRRVSSGLAVGADLAKAIAVAGLRPEIVDAASDALEGHVDPGAIRAGVRMRVAATEDWVEGTFARVKVDAIEFVPKSGAPIRVYRYERDPAEVEGSSRRAPLAGFYDSKGRQPYHGQFRSPLPLARVTSRFNPKRMHPVLKVIMPHNGVDFGGASGTPVYASAAGTVITAGNGGPCGNMVEIDHGGGITTAYCHLKAFAQGLHSGQKVEARQHIGYVGQTGRVTGPHLHFVVKKNGVFVDPLAMKMDGVRVLPPADRDAFARKRGELDAVIDGVLLPSVTDIPDENDDKDLHAE